MPTIRASNNATYANPTITVEAGDLLIWSGSVNNYISTPE